MYERITPRDWHDAKFKQLDQRAVLKRLWDLENQLEESTKPHYYVTTGSPKRRDFVLYGDPCIEYTDTYVVAEGTPSDLAVHFGIYDSKEEAETRAAELNQHPFVHWEQYRIGIGEAYDNNLSILR